MQYTTTKGFAALYLRPLASGAELINCRYNTYANDVYGQVCDCVYRAERYFMRIDTTRARRFSQDLFCLAPSKYLPNFSQPYFVVPRSKKVGGWPPPTSKATSTNDDFSEVSKQILDSTYIIVKMRRNVGAGRGGSDAQDAHSPGASVAEVVKANTTAKAGNNDSAADAATDAAKTEEGAPTTVKKTRKHLFQLTIKRTDESLPVKKMTAEAKAKAQEILKLMDEADKNRARREEARNSLEAYSFVSREKLDSNEADVKLVMSPEALEDVIRELRQVEDWIDDHRDASADDYIQERARLASKVDKIFHLIREHQERPAAVKAFRSLIRSLEDRRANWTTERPWIPEKVWEIVDKAQADALKWADDMEAKQAKLTPKEEPVLSLSSIRAEMEKIQKMVELLLKQRRPPPTNTGAAKKKTTSGEDKKDGANNNKTEEASSEDYTNTASGEGYASSNQQESGGGEEQQQQSQQEGDSDEKKTNEEEKKDATPEKEEL